MNKLRFNEQCIVDTKWASYQIIQGVPEFSFFLHLVISFYSIYFTVRLFHTDQPIFNFTVCLLFRLLCIDQPTYASAKNLFVWIDDAPAIDSTLNISNKQIKNLEIKPKIEKSYRVFNHTKYNSLVLPSLYIFTSIISSLAEKKTIYWFRTHCNAFSIEQYTYI